MPIKGTFTAIIDEPKIRRKFATRKETAIRRIAQTLAYIGEKCVTIAREDHAGNWNDITGNLRSSIGYTVLIDGVPMAQLENQFEQHPGEKGDGAEGAAAAKKLIEALRPRYSQGITLIVVAGMKYATYVENVHNRVVLSESKLECDRLARKLLKSLVKQR